MKKHSVLIEAFIKDMMDMQKVKRKKAINIILKELLGEYIKPK